MTTRKDYYGKNVTEVIKQACREFGIPQEELDIEVLETGSAGIFGLCKKKAHIRVAPKRKQDQTKRSPAPTPRTSTESAGSQERQPQGGNLGSEEKSIAAEDKVRQAQSQEQGTSDENQELSGEILAAIRTDLGELLKLMGAPSTVTAQLRDNTVECQISTDYEEILSNNEGRTLDSLQYLMRKMMIRRLPERMMLSLDVGDFRQRRAEELRVKALELAEKVKQDGKTQALAPLNPSERRVVHMVLQEDREIRSRSVGEGLFKKVLIYKLGKRRKTGARKRRGRQSGRSSGK